MELKITEFQTIENWIGGQKSQSNGNKIDVTSPYTNQVIGSIPISDSEMVNTAIHNAHSAYKEWSTKPLKERCNILFSTREILLKQIDNISHIIASESGKTHAEAKAGLLKGIEVLEFALSLQNTDYGGRMEVSRGVYCEYQREALGVVAGITPFNFPAMVPMWMIPIALVCGNSFIWKPSEKTPLTSQYIADCFHQAGLPAGALNIIQGDKSTVDAILNHDLVKAVGFVGSTTVAKSVYQKATANFKRALALGGAKNHIILMPDAKPELAGPGICSSFTGCAGQRCMAAANVIAVGHVNIQPIVEASKKIQLGKDMGAIITKESLNKLHAAIEQAEKDGAKVLLDGRKVHPPKEYKDGYWLGPTIIDHVKPGSQAATEELFGPILSILRTETLSEALDIENQSPYGNAASVFTDSGSVAQEVVKRAQAGMIGVNIGVPVPREPFSFGGMYESRFGHGDITGSDGIEFWSQKKKLTTKWIRQSDENWMS